QLLADRIQKEENSVPSATMLAATTCAQRGTRSRPNRSTPRKAASRKKAVSPSKAKSGDNTLAVASAYRLQLVPNWNGMTMPVTTPIPKEIEKILIQNIDTRR